MNHYQGPTQPHTPIRVVEPGSPEHDAWKALQDARRKVAEMKFEQSSHLRPAHWNTKVADV